MMCANPFEKRSSTKGSEGREGEPWSRSQSTEMPDNEYCGYLSFDYPSFSSSSDQQELVINP